MPELLKYRNNRKNDPSCTSVTTTVRIRRDLYDLARANEVNFTQTLNAVLEQELLKE